MSGALKPYPTYKESGVEWLGAVPEGWEVVPFKTVGTHNDEVLPESTPDGFQFDYVEIGNVSLVHGIQHHSNVNFGTAPSRARRIARTGDVLVSTVRTYLKAIAIVPDREIPYVASTGFAVLRPGRRLASRYLGRIVQSEYFVSEIIARSVGVSYPAINATEVVALPVPLPPLPEQQAIADYLDAETQRIDTLIAELREMIRLLKEKRQALISQCVTKGLDPTVPMKYSGVEWLGEVPEGWEVGRIKYYLDLLQDGTHFSPESYPEGDRMYLTAKNIRSWGIDLSNVSYIPKEVHQEIYKRCPVKEGDVLFIKDGATAGTATLNTLTEEFSLLSSVAAIRPDSRLDSRYLCYQLTMESFMDSVQDRLVGGAMTRFTLDAIGRFVIALPPLPEQHAIADHLDRETTKIDRLISETEETITLMQERRSALISSVVTGKLQVPGIPSPSGSTLNSRPEKLR